MYEFSVPGVLDGLPPGFWADWFFYLLFLFYFYFYTSTGGVGPLRTLIGPCFYLGIFLCRR